jgi:hypothetical protein
VVMIHLKLETVILGLRCSFNNGEELEFSYKTLKTVVVRFTQREQHDTDRSAGVGETAICLVLARLDIEPDVKSQIDQAIEAGRVNFNKMNRKSLKIIDDCFFHLRDVSRSTVTLFNWIHGLDGPPDPLGWADGRGRAQALYSEDGERWLKYSLARTIGLLFEEATHSIFARNAQIDELVRKVEAGAQEPLARQVFREAWSHIGVNPRSALVLGVSAAEVAVRSLIGTLIPDAKWLVDELQTPPVGKMLRKFLPTLPVRARWADGRPITLPTKLIGLVEKAFERRNDVAHVGASPPSRKELANMLRAIDDLLWFCDVYSGEHWAMKHISVNWKSKTD